MKKKAPDAWIVAYYESAGRPWSNPRLSVAEQYRLKYRLHPEFASNERAKVSRRRFVNPSYAAQWDGDKGRWWRAKESADGSINVDLIKNLQTEPFCAYCGRRIESREIDHVWPISRGGAHSGDNVVAACDDCNSEKRAKLPLEWFAIVARRGGNLAALQ